jgi:hypothetical protein
VKQVLNGNIADSYGNPGSGAFNQWFHRNLDMGIMKELRGLTTPGIGAGNDIITSWNHFNPTSYNPNDPMAFDGNHYWYNMYAYADFQRSSSQRDRLYGNIALTYKVNKDLKFTGTYRKQQNTTFNEGRTYNILERSGSSTGERAAYSTGSSYSNRENYEFVGSYTKKIKDFSVDATAGSDFFVAKSNGNSANTNNGLSIPDLFTVNNSIDPPSVGNSRSQEKYRALFGRVSLGYKNLLFLEGSLRNDWFSTLPTQKNDIMSKSVGASFIFTDLLPANLNLSSQVNSLPICSLAASI